VCGTQLADYDVFCPLCAFKEALETQTHALSNSFSELRFEHYTVLQNAEGKPFELGRGGMGVTYKAFDVHLQRPAALKIINAQFLGDESTRARFVREARAAARVRHQNVATVFHIGESGGNHYYAMELVEGESLAALIRRSGCLQLNLALDILEQVAAGLAAIEKQHLVHRDIKPSNIMVSLLDGKLEDVKIIDLGLAKGVAEENALSTVGVFIGTPAYASPEQFAGIVTDIRSDLYSLGVTLWEMLSGQLPFSGSVTELIYLHQRAEPPVEKLKNVPVPVIELLQELLAKDPSRRFQTPAQLQQAVAKVRETIAFELRLTTVELKVTGDRATKHSSKGKPAKKIVRWLLGVGSSLAVALVAWFFLSGHAALLFNQQPTEAVATEKSIAVLPFDNISPNKDDAYFADGVQDEILNDLAKIAQLKVISRTSVMQYRADTKRDLRQIAMALGVANVLEGTVRREANHVRVSTELIDARNDNTIWADSYDRDLTSIFDIQNDIAKTVVAKLSARLSTEEKEEIDNKPTNDLEAYDLYLQAKALIVSAELFIGHDRESFLNVVRLLEEATRKDPKFALAYCLVARAHDDLYFSLLDHTPERRGLGDAAINEALRLRPDLPEVHLAVAYHLYECYRSYQRASVQIAIAERALPNSPAALALRAYIDRRQGRWDDSIKALKMARTLDPRNPNIINNLEFNYLCLRRHRQAEEACNALLELEPENPIFILQKAYCAFAESADLTGYRAALEQLPSPMKNDIGFASQRIFYAALARDWTTAQEILRTDQSEDLSFLHETIVPRGCVEIWLAKVRGDQPMTEPRFYALREQLERRVEADLNNPSLLSALGVVDAALGRKEDALRETSRAVEMLPISEDAMDGPALVFNLAIAYAWTGEPDLAIGQLKIAVETPGGIDFGELKLNPALDSLRDDPRFARLLAELAPHD